MANPSLQIGNSNWAIKEDNLLGYSTAGTRFVPQPITMTRASAGTRVNSSGLVETVELLGSELVDCGDFECASPLTDWTVVGLVTIGSGVAKFLDNGTNTNSRIAQSVLTTNKTYKLVFEITRYVAGRIQILSGGGTYLVDISGGVGLYTTIIQSVGSTTFTLKRNGGYSGYDFDIDNVSVKEYTANNLARVDYDGTASSLLVEPERRNLVTYSEVYGAGTYFSATNGSTIDNITSISPSGDANATQLTSTGAGKLQTAGLALTQNTDYTLSFYAKNVDATAVTSRVLALGGSGGSNLTSVDYTSQLSTTEWTRITHSFNTGTNTTIYVYLSNALNSGGTIQLWGAQLEEASYATSYIPTSGSTVTRNQDIFSRDGIGSLINSTEGVLFVEMSALADDLTGRSISLNDGTYANTVILRYLDLSNQIQGVVRIGGSFKGICTHTLSDSTISIKVAYKWKDSDFALWINGSEVATSSDVGAFSTDTINKLSFDKGDDTQDFFGKVKQLQVFKTALTDTELATLTT